MSMKRKCYFCGKPVDIRRQMSLFCSSRCEALESSLPGAGQGSHPAQPPAASSMPASARSPFTGK